MKKKVVIFIILALAGSLVSPITPTIGGLIDKTKAPNTANEGINKSLKDEIGAGRGSITIPKSSLFIIKRDPFRAISRGRQIFQRKFTREEGQGPGVGDGRGDVHTMIEIGAGLSDSCSGCHALPRGSAGFGGDVVTRPDSRNAQHLFGLGLKEMLADEITADLRSIRDKAISNAKSSGHSVTQQLTSKGINYGLITANSNGSVDTSRIEGIDPDLRIRPFFAHGGTISIREFVFGALHGEMGIHAFDPDLTTANTGGKITTPSGMVLDGSTDKIQPSTAKTKFDMPEMGGAASEMDYTIVDYLEFYLLNYFKPATYKQTETTLKGRQVFKQILCAMCHIPSLRINKDRRVADVETVYDPGNGIFNNLFATATPLYDVVDDGNGLPPLKTPKLKPFLVDNIFTDFKRHDLGPNFHERNYDGTINKLFLTTALWGVGSTPTYGHDGRSINLTEVILRHGGEAQASRDAFAILDKDDQTALLDFLNSLVLFTPDDTASNLDPGNRNAPGFPQRGHGKVKLSVLFNDPDDPE